METLEEGTTRIVQVTEIIVPYTVKDVKPELPKETSGVRKSSRVKFQTKQDYIPRMTGSKYAVTVAHLEDHGALHPDAHILYMRIQEEHLDLITAIMAQLSLKVILK